MMSKMRVGVFMGGRSDEHEVSFNSGRTICDHLDSMRYEIIPIYQTKQGSLYQLPWPFLYRGKTDDFVEKLKSLNIPLTWDDLKKIIDCAYIAMHGQFAEDGCLQGILEILSIPYVGSKVLASALGMDKLMQKYILRHHSIRVPRFCAIKPNELATFCMKQIVKRIKEAQIHFPCIIKPACQGSSIGINVVDDEKNLENALHASYAASGKTTQTLLIEEKIEGMEFTCIVITDCKNGSFIALPPTHIIHDADIPFFNYEQKYMPGRSLQITPAQCSEELLEKIKSTCIQTMHALQFSNIGRIDGFLTDTHEVIIIDPNSFSGAAPSSFLFKQAAHYHMNHTQLINHLIQTELHAFDESTLMKSSNKSNSSNKKMRVAVLFGGASHEKEISLESGRNVIYKLFPEKYTPITLYVSTKFELFLLNELQLLSSSTAVIENEIRCMQPILWNDLPQIADFVFIALHGGKGENGCVQGMLTMLDLPYNGSPVLPSALCMNKIETNTVLKECGFDVPREILIGLNACKINQTSCKKIEQQIGTPPWIAKPNDDGCSTLTYKINHYSELQSLIERFKLGGKNTILLGELIRGIELTVGVIGNNDPHVLPASQVITKNSVLTIEEKFLPGCGENQTPALLSQSAYDLLKKTIAGAYRTLDCKGYARIDCFYQDASISPTGLERIIILEINTLPALTPATCLFHQAAEIGLKPMDFIDLIITLGIEKHQNKSAIFPNLPKKFVHQEQT